MSNPFTPLGWCVVTGYVLLLLAMPLCGWPSWFWVPVVLFGLVLAAGLVLRLRP